MRRFLHDHSFSLAGATGWAVFTGIAFLYEPGRMFDTWQNLAGAFLSTALFAILARYLFERKADPTVEPE